MTETEWLSCADPATMLAFLAGRVSGRKVRLFACACCRRVWAGVTLRACRAAVELAERHADGAAEPAELQETFVAAQKVRPLFADANWAAAWAAAPSPPQAAAEASLLAAQAVARSAGEWARGKARAAVSAGAVDAARTEAWDRFDAAVTEALRKERRRQADLLRDVIGNPSQPPTPVAAGLLTWQAGAAVQLAEAIYADRTFTDLPVLADALEEAGASDAELLAHCRSPGEHARGCWALDLVLGKA